MKSAKSPVSVIIPTYNRSWGLRRAVASVLAQTCADFELIITDDASTDDTEEVVRSFDDPRISYCRQPANVGVARNWGSGVEQARGEFVALLMDDDRYEPEFLARRVAALNRCPNALFVFSSYRVETTDGRLVKEHVPPLAPNELLCGPSLLSAVLGRAVFVGATLYRRTALQAIWPKAQAAGIIVDYAANLRLAVQPGAAAVFLGGIDFVVADHPGQLGRTRLGEAFSAGAAIVGDLLAEVPPGWERKLVRRELSSWYVEWARWSARQHDRRGAVRRLGQAVALRPFAAGPWKQLFRVITGL